MFSELRGEQQRQLIDSADTFEAWRNANMERRRRFAGGVRWAERNGRRYLLRKIGAKEQSLGPESAATKDIYDSFVGGRERNHEMLSGLAARLDQMAPVNKALGLGRVPVLAARILRDLDERELLGHQLLVVGTNALYAYEARAGLRFSSDLLATGDVDLLLDGRQRLSLVVREIRDVGLLGVLRRLDHSFSAVQKGGFRAVNRDGYYVDLIRPQARDIMRDDSPDALSSLPEELHRSPIEGLAWLVNAPRFHAIAIAEDGYPVPFVCLDPRVFALHKAWMSQDEKRDPRKKARDMSQAKACAEIAGRLGMPFENEAALSVLPASVRALENVVRSDLDPRGGSDAERRLTPNW
ncbi:MAG: nucleotidyltransferase domain-containing protein [Rhizobiaceae bacterium]|nr:nucleotidyltransferase domain-containing protein [Rhizobiaceae bacterium]